jgi:hypothetical protein
MGPPPPPVTPKCRSEQAGARLITLCWSATSACTYYLQLGSVHGHQDRQASVVELLAVGQRGHVSCVGDGWILIE